jgi:hypothetical protein
MKLVMTLLVQDEEDILRDHLSFHLDRGVDFVIVTDNDSRDSTPEILEEFRREGVVRVIEEAGDDFSQSKWVTQMARMAAVEESADWVINSDADEFWWTDEGDLKSVLSTVPERYGQVAVERLNFVPVASEDGSPIDRMVIRRTKSVNALGRPVQPKVCHRADPEVVVSQGNHSVGPSGRLRLYKAAVPIVIFHFPQRSYSHFENRSVRGGQAYERNTDTERHMGAHWRDNYLRFQNGSLRQSWDNRVHDTAKIEQGFAEHRLTEDRRLADAIAAIRAGRISGRADPN